MMRFKRRVFSEFEQKRFTLKVVLASTRFSNNHLEEILKCDKLGGFFFKIN